MIKNFELRTLVLSVLLTLAFQATKTFRSFIRRTSGVVVATVRADLYVLRNLRTLLRRRSEVQRRRMVDDRELSHAGLFASMYASLAEFMDHGR